MRTRFYAIMRPAPRQFDGSVTRSEHALATLTKLNSGSWRVQVRRKGKYVNDRFLRRKDAEDWALHRRYRRDAIAWINREKSITPDKPFFVYFAPGAAIRSAPPIYQRSHRITANIVVPDDKTEGVIVATGGGGAGDTLYVKGGKVVYEHNFVDRARYRVVSDIPLPRRRRGHPRPRAETLQAIHREHPRPSDGKPAGEGEIANVTPGRFSATETLDIGMDLGSTISMDYSDKAPFAFTCTIKTVRIDLT